MSDQGYSCPHCHTHVWRIGCDLEGCTVQSNGNDHRGWWKVIVTKAAVEEGMMPHGASQKDLDPDGNPQSYALLYLHACCDEHARALQEDHAGRLVSCKRMTWGGG